MCIERCMHGSERGDWNNTGYLLYLIGRWFDPSWAHLKFVVPCPTHILFLFVLRWFQSKMRPGRAHIINWNQVDLTKLCTVNGMAYSQTASASCIASRKICLCPLHQTNATRSVHQLCAKVTSSLMLLCTTIGSCYDGFTASPSCILSPLKEQDCSPIASEHLDNQIVSHE